MTQQEGLDALPLGAVYRERRLGQRVGYGRNPAVVVVDMQVGINDASQSLGADMEEALDAIADVLAAARAKDVITVYVWSAWSDDAADSGRWRDKLPALSDMRLGTPAVEIHERIAPRDGDTMVLKKGPSSFFNTPLDDVLRDADIDTVILVGASTSGCIRATAIESLSHGYRTVVPAEAVGDRAPEPHRANLFDIDAKYGDVQPLQAALEFLADLPADVAQRRSEAEAPPRVARGEAAIWTGAGMASAEAGV